MAPQDAAEPSQPANSTVGKLLRQLGDDVGADSTGGKTLKASGTVIEAYKEWQLSLASNSGIADVVWVAARQAWKPPITPTSAETALFAQKIATILTVDDDRRGNIFKRVTFRSRPQPLVVMRLLCAQNMDIGPWLATLVAAVHAGAVEAVRSWASQTLMTVGAQGAVDFGLQQEDMFILLRQADQAADSLVADLQAIAANRYWSKISKASLSEFVETLPLLPHRDITADWWRGILDHYVELDMPVYRLGRHPPKGIKLEGSKIGDSADLYSVMNVEDFMSLVTSEFLDPLSKKEELSKEYQDTWERAVAETAELSSDDRVLETLSGGISLAKNSLVSGSRVVAFDMAQNISGLLEVGLCAGNPYRSTAFIRSLCYCVAGSSCGFVSGDYIVCIQTPVGLFLPYLPDIVNQDAWQRWHLQALRLDQLSDGAGLAYSDGYDRVLSREHAGIGPMTNRPMSADDTISGVVTARSGGLEALCLIRGELAVVNFSRILARLQDSRCAPSTVEYSRQDLEDEYSLSFSYITCDVVLKLAREDVICVGDEEHRLLIIAGSSTDWQMLSLAVTPGRVVFQGSADATDCALYARQIKAEAVIAGEIDEKEIEEPVSN